MPYDPDLKLPPSQHLVAEVLIARKRLGHNVWTMSASAVTTKALKGLEERGLVSYKSGVIEKTWMVWLTDHGKDTLLYPNYVAPILGGPR